MISRKGQFKKPLVLASLGVLAALLTGCGGTAYREANIGDYTPPLGNGNNVTPTPTPAPSSDGNFIPAVAFAFTMTGVGGTEPTFTTPEVDTDNLLKIRVNAGSSGVLSLSDGSYSGFSGSYGCISYSVTVLGKTLQTGLLATAYPGASCQGAPSSQVLDFSDRLGQGHGGVTIQVSSARYDFYCQMYDSSPYYQWLMGYNRALYCPSRPVYKNHTVAGSIDVQVNGTSF